MNNKTKFLAVIALSILSLSARAEKIALINGTLINPGNSQETKGRKTAKAFNW